MPIETSAVLTRIKGVSAVIYGYEQDSDTQDASNAWSSCRYNTNNAWNYNNNGYTNNNNFYNANYAVPCVN